MTKRQWELIQSAILAIRDEGVSVDDTSPFTPYECDETIQALSGQVVAEPLSVTMSFDEEEAKGVVSLVRGSYGPTFVVDGRHIGYVDLFPKTDGGVAQIIVYDMVEEPLAKIVLADDIVVVVNKDAEPATTEQTIHAFGDIIRTLKK